MKIKTLSLVCLLILSSCGKKSSTESSFLGGFKDTLITEDKSVVEQKVDERTCIDARLNKDLDSGESIAKLVDNADITFCNGVHLRLKTYKFASKKYKVYGYVESNSGHETCLQESEDFSRSWPLGDKGVIVGDNIKILLGGHQFDSDHKLVPSEHFLSRHVEFEWGSYSGEMAIFEKGKLRCWAIQ